MYFKSKTVRSHTLSQLQEKALVSISTCHFFHCKVCHSSTVSLVLNLSPNILISFYVVAFFQSFIPSRYGECALKNPGAWSIAVENNQKLVSYMQKIIKYQFHEEQVPISNQYLNHYDYKINKKPLSLASFHLSVWQSHGKSYILAFFQGVSSHLISVLLKYIYLIF